MASMDRVNNSMAHLGQVRAISEACINQALCERAKLHAAGCLWQRETMRVTNNSVVALCAFYYSEEEAFVRGLIRLDAA